MNQTEYAVQYRRPGTKSWTYDCYDGFVCRKQHARRHTEERAEAVARSFRENALEARVVPLRDAKGS